MNDINIKRGEIFYADLNPVIGSEQEGIRPVLIIQNDIGNKYSPTVIGVPITSAIKKINLPTHIPISASIAGLSKNSIILVEQIRTLDKSRLKNKIGMLDPLTLEKVKKALKANFNLRSDFNYLFDNW